MTYCLKTHLPRWLSIMASFTPTEPQKQKVATALSLKGKENISSKKKRTRDDDVVAAGPKNVSIILTNSIVTSLTIKQHYVNEDEDGDEDEDEDEDDNSEEEWFF